jgi:hypothetical protein
MIPLATPSLPASPDSLEEAIRAGFARYAIAARSVKATGPATTDLESLHIDLSGAEISRELRIEQPGSLGAETVTTRHLKIDATPLLLEGAPMEFHLQAEQVTLVLTQPVGTERVLSPCRAQNGRLSAEITREALESLLRKVATELAGKQGVEIKEVHLKLENVGPRLLRFEAEVVAKVFLMKAPVILQGNAQIDDALNLQLSDLTVGGNNMAANIANSFARPHLERVQKEPFSLAVLSLGEIQLRDVEVAGGDSLRLNARFGS